MDLTKLVSSMRFVELRARTRPTALRALVEAANLNVENVTTRDVLDAIEEREAAAQTIIAPGFALPHAQLDWDGEYQIVVGRSRNGVDYGVAAEGRIQLVVLLLVGKGREKLHLELLAALAELLESEEFRHTLIEAPDTRAIERMLKSGIGVEDEPRKPPPIPRLSILLVRQAVQLVESLSSQALLLAVDKPENVPWDVLEDCPHHQVLVVTSERDEDFQSPRPHTEFFDVPHASLSRTDRAKLGLLLAGSSGILKEGGSVVCVTGPDGRHLDSITVAKPGKILRGMLGGRASRSSRTAIRPAVILRVLSLAIELAAEGREGRPVGALFVIGDTPQVMRQTQQLVLNPFYGFRRQLRNVIDPSLTETIKEFAVIDGAFIIQSDGTVVSAGTYLTPKTYSSNLPSGLGTRHRTAAAITAHTQALAVVVSESTGTVTVFRNGQMVFTLERAIPTQW